MVHTFLLFFGLKLNLTKSETAGIRVLKEVHVAVCSMRCLDLNNNAIKVLGIPFRYNEKLKDEIYFYATVTDIERVLKIWKIRSLILEGKIVIFKSIAVSKIVFLSLIAIVSKHIVKVLEKSTKELFMEKLYA